jgi:hypothetical protein
MRNLFQAMTWADRVQRGLRACGQRVMLSSLQNISDTGTIDETPVATVGPVRRSRRRLGLLSALPIHAGP